MSHSPKEEEREMIGFIEDTIFELRKTLNNLAESINKSDINSNLITSLFDKIQGRAGYAKTEVDAWRRRFEDEIPG